MRKTWTQEEEEFLISSYSQMTDVELTSHFGLSWAAIKCKANKLGLSKSVPTYSIQEVLADYLQDLPLAELCEKHNIPTTSLYRLLASNNIARRNNKILEQQVEKAEISKEELEAAYLSEGLTILQLSQRFFNTSHTGKIRRLLKKYRINKPTQDVAAQRKQTCNIRYGGNAPACSVAVQQKAIATSLEKFGTNNPALSEEIKGKIIETCNTHYGVDRPFQNAGILKQAQTTLDKKYGPGGLRKDKDVELKIKNTNLERYGVDNYGKTEEWAKRMSDTCIARYGKFPVSSYGKTQEELQAWLNSFGYNFQPSWELLSPRKEIDLYDPTLKLAIEYCGLYWHNENSPSPRDRNYHHNKLLQCEAQGIRLITIFEDEWLHRESQVKSFLLSVINKNSNKYYGRKCDVGLISKAIGQEFIEQYHIQGKNALGKYFAGLYHHTDELLGVMSFGTHHRDSSQLTLDRLCFKTDISVAGGSSKLFKFLLAYTNLKSIISWSDNRWSCGKVYSSLGFTLEENLKPDYSYVQTNKPTVRISKQSQQKSSTGCPDNVTEKEWANQQGLSRIWDCGKKRWKFTVTEV